MTHEYNDEDDEFFNDRGPEDDCFHEYMDVDILAGRALCLRCGHAWWMTDKEMEDEIKLQVGFLRAELE